MSPSDKSIIVADTGNNALRRIHKGMVYTLAGSKGNATPEATAGRMLTYADIC